MTQDLNGLALAAKADPRARENLIMQEEQTILKMASKAVGHFITTSDDEWSVALYAFSKAIDSYDAEKGDFAGYASLIIRRDLVDEYRREARHAPEVSTANYVLEGNAEPEEDPDHVLQAVARESMARAEAGWSLQEEILEAGREFGKFGFSFMDLTACSPKQDRTREACALIVRLVLSRPELVRRIRDTGQLPGAEIRRGTGASEKLLEKYRKYLLAAVLILSGDYPQMAEFLRYIREGGSTS